ncbi:hypothetical protein NPIL_397571, partial [Nephila pilipes]
MARKSKTNLYKPTTVTKKFCQECAKKIENEKNWKNRWKKARNEEANEKEARMKSEDKAGMERDDKALEKL